MELHLFPLAVITTLDYGLGPFMAWAGIALEPVLKPCFRWRRTQLVTLNSMPFGTRSGLFGPLRDHGRHTRGRLERTRQEMPRPGRSLVGKGCRPWLESGHLFM